MSPFKVIRSKPQVPLPARLFRVAEGAFWFVLALALAFGGPSAKAGLPIVGRLMTFGGIAHAEASGPLVLRSVRLALPGFAESDEPPTVHPSAGRDLPAWLHFAADAPAPAAAVAAVPASRQPMIAIVIDDMGSDPVRARRAMALPQEIALSFLPYAMATPGLAREASRAGHDVMAHVPMQAEADADPGPMALMVDQSGEENVRRLDWALSRVPGFVGINNHMGSRFTETRESMVPVMQALEDRHIFFFDSVTSPRTLAARVARSFGVASAGRDIFLDDVQTPEEVTRELAQLEKIARSQGIALAIGHPHDVTLAILERWCATLPAKGIRLVRIRDGIRMKTERENGVSVADLSRTSP